MCIACIHTFFPHFAALLFSFFFTCVCVRVLQYTYQDVHAGYTTVAHMRARVCVKNRIKKQIRRSRRHAL